MKLERQLHLQKMLEEIFQVVKTETWIYMKKGRASKMVTVKVKGRFLFFSHYKRLLSKAKIIYCLFMVSTKIKSMKA